jgi:hypothetical protein
MSKKSLKIPKRYSEAVCLRKVRRQQKDNLKPYV